MEQQQCLTGDATPDVALAYRRKLVATGRIGQRHVQLADLENVHVGYRQLDEYAQHPRQQRSGAPHGDVDHFAEGVAEADPAALDATDE